MKECLQYKKIDSRTVRCQTCSHFCKINNGGVGICGIRQAGDGKLYLLTHGKIIAVHVDPIEKKPLFHFLPGSAAYSIGMIGCNMRCANCQNYDISQMFGEKGNAQDYNSLHWGYPMKPKDIVAEARKAGCESIAYTYNEPTISLEYVLEVMSLAKEKKIKNVWVSNGFMSVRTLDLIVPLLDAINIDIKSFEDDFYRKNCGAKLAPILENCKKIVKKGIWLEITTLVIPTLSDDPDMLARLAKFIAEKLGIFIPWHISAFSGAISWKLQDVPNTSIPAVKKAYQIGKEAGLKYVYGGNVLNEEIESTHCPGCGRIIVRRSGYQVIRLDKKGSCAFCGEKIDGIFE